jgi:hypothetical protein
MMKTIGILVVVALSGCAFYGGDDGADPGADAGVVAAGVGGGWSLRADISPCFLAGTVAIDFDITDGSMSDVVVEGYAVTGFDFEPDVVSISTDVAEWTIGIADDGVTATALVSYGADGCSVDARPATVERDRQ